jgi:hypothetical protein
VVAAAATGLLVLLPRGCCWCRCRASAAVLLLLLLLLLPPSSEPASRSLVCSPDGQQSANQSCWLADRGHAAGRAIGGGGLLAGGEYKKGSRWRLFGGSRAAARVSCVFELCCGRLMVIGACVKVARRGCGASVRAPIVCSRLDERRRRRNGSKRERDGANAAAAEHAPGRRPIHQSFDFTLSIQRHASSTLLYSAFHFACLAHRGTSGPCA